MTNINNLIDKLKIQGRVETLVINSMELSDNVISFDLVKESIISEFGNQDEVIEEAKRQYNFMTQY